MKYLGRLFATLVLFLFLFIPETKAQVSFSLSLGFVPQWAPEQYAHRTRYYYLPELDCYYDARLGGYYFHDQDGDDWFFTRELPNYCGGYNFYNGPKIELEYFGARPFDFFNERRRECFNEFHPQGYAQFDGRYQIQRGLASGWGNRVLRNENNGWHSDYNPQFSDRGAERRRREEENFRGQENYNFQNQGYTGSKGQDWNRGDGRNGYRNRENNREENQIPNQENNGSRNQNTGNANRGGYYQNPNPGNNGADNYNGGSRGNEVHNDRNQSINTENRNNSLLPARRFFRGNSFQ